MRTLDFHGNVFIRRESVITNCRWVNWGSRNSVIFPKDAVWTLKSRFLEFSLGSASTPWTALYFPYWLRCREWNLTSKACASQGSGRGAWGVVLEGCSCVLCKGRVDGAMAPAEASCNKGSGTVGWTHLSTTCPTREIQHSWPPEAVW